MYRKGLVCFVDILGTKNCSFGQLYKIANIFHDELEGAQERHNPNSVGDRRIYGFSDCAYIIYALNDEYLNNDEVRLKYVYTSLFNIAYMLSVFMNNGFIFRGGVSYDDVYFEKDRSVFFGPAINKAYHLESKEAVVPRVLLSDELAADVIEFERILGNDNVFAQMNAHILMKDDEDGRFFINYLNVFYQMEEVGFGQDSMNINQMSESSLKSSKELISLIEEQFGSSVEEYTLKKQRRIHDKHKWHVWYLNAALKELHDAPKPLTVDELIALYDKP